MIQPELSFVIPAKSPIRLAGFYSFVIGEEIQPGFNQDHLLICHPNGSTIQIYRPSGELSFPLTQNSMGLCFQGEPSTTPLNALEEWVGELLSKGAKIISSTSLQSFGAEAWLSDPEGNCFLLLVPLQVE